jgi:DNA modification methylase
MESLVRRNYRSELRELDWDFPGGPSSDSLARIHWYPARFVPQVPGILIGYFSERGQTILDPFCGSGTSVVEGLRAGRYAIGGDTNPVASLITRAKCLDLSEKDFDGYRQALIARITGVFAPQRATEELAIPNIAENRGWYEDGTLRELVAVWSGIQSVGGPYKDLGVAAFSATLKSVSSQDKHWGWVCDNVKPTSLVYRPAYTSFVRKLTDFGAAVTAASVERMALFPNVSLRQKVEIFTGPCATCLATRADSSVDMVVTSPPYFGVTDYIRSQRLTMLWLDYDLDALKASESGARYKRFRKDPLPGYLEDMRASFAEIARVLKPGGMCCIVIGESPRRAPYLDAFAQLLSAVGLVLEDELSRHITKQRTLNPQLQTEKILILQKARVKS